MKKQDSYIIQFKDKTGKNWFTVPMTRGNFAAAFIIAQIKKSVIIAYFKIKYK